MPPPDNLLAFFVVAAALVASPGPDSILILKNTMASGRLPGWCTMAGVQVGVSIHALLSVAGLSALLYYSSTAFRVLALAGSLYLAYLGFLTIRHGIALSVQAARVVSPRRAFVQGTLCNLLNPKVIVLFVALMPTFVDMDAGNEGRQIIVLALLLLAINIPFQAVLVLAAARISRLLAAPRTARWVYWSLGGVLLFFALTLFAEHALSYTR